MGRVLGGQRGVRRGQFCKFARRPVEDRHRERAGQRLPERAQLRAQAGDLGLEFCRVVRAQGPDALRVVEFVQGDGGRVEGVGQGVPVVVGDAQHAADAVAAEEEGVGGVGGSETSARRSVAAFVKVSCAASSSSWDSSASATITQGAGSRGAEVRTPSMIALASASWPYSQRFDAFRARTRWGWSRGAEDDSRRS